MARRPRRWFPGAITRVFAEEGVECFAWAVLVNHYHLLVRFPGPPKRTMQRLNTAIACRVRRRSDGCGPVFQGRFFSAPGTDHSSLLSRFAYVTANPIHHRVVASIDRLEL